MNLQPKVSVIIPAFNVVDCISRAIDSALQQEGVAVEIIVVDDCSSDGTPEQVEKSYAGDDRVRVLRRQVNGGPGAARNDGFAAGRGEWLALLDADDWWKPWRLSQMLQHADSHDFIADNIMSYDLGHQVEVAPVYPIDSDRTLRLIDFIRPMNEERHDYGYLQPLIRRSFLEKHGIRYDESVRVGEDLLLNMEIMAAGGRALLMHRAGYVYVLPVGPVSGQASPFSKSAAASSDLIEAIKRFQATHADRLSAGEQAAIVERLKRIGELAAIGAFHLAKARRQYVRMAYLALTNWRVQLRILKRLAGLSTT